MFKLFISPPPPIRRLWLLYDYGLGHSRLLAACYSELETIEKDTNNPAKAAIRNGLESPQYRGGFPSAEQVKAKRFRFASTWNRRPEVGLNFQVNRW